MARFLFTGSREWSDPTVLVRAVVAHMKRGDTLVHGAAEGLDELAAAMWAPFGPVEGHRAVEHASPKARNLYMISLGADGCLAFARSWVSGSGHCARRAREAGIPVWDYGVDTRVEARPGGAGPRGS